MFASFRHVAGLGALVGSIAAIAQAAQGHSNDEISLTILAGLLIGLSVWLLREGTPWSSWQRWGLMPIIMIVISTGSDTGSWFAVVPLGAIMLVTFELLRRREPEAA